MEVETKERMEHMFWSRAYMKLQCFLHTNPWFGVAFKLTYSWSNREDLQIIAAINNRTKMLVV